MKYLNLLFTLALFVPFAASAQNSKYQPGYVVTSSGDTVHGLINDRQPERNPISVSISRSDNKQTQQFDLNTAQAFGVYGRFEYKKYHVSISQDEPGVTPAGKEASPRTDDIFLRVLLRGADVSLFQYTDNIKTRFYIIEKGTAPTELIYHEYKNENTGGTIEQTPYKLQLQKLAATYHPNDQKLVDEIQTGSYKDYSLTEIVANINGSDHSVQVSQPAKQGIRFFAGADIRFITNSYSSSDPDDNLNGAANNNSVSPQVNAGADFFFDKEKQLFVFRLEAGVYADKVSFSHNYNGGSTVSTNTYTQKLSFNRLNLSITPQIILNVYNSSNLKFYIDAGVNMTSVHYSNKTFTDITYFSATSTTQIQNENNYFPATLATVFYIPVKVGFVIDKRVDIYAGYTPKTDYSAVAGSSSISASSFQAGINYLFGGQ